MSGQGKHKNLQLVQWLRNPWVRCDNVARGPIPEWQAALMFEAANVIGQLETTRTPDPAQIRADALREALEIANNAVAKRIRQIEEERKKPTNNIDVPQMMRWGAGKLQAELIADEIAALLAPPLSPTAVDGSPAPDSGGKP